MDEMEITQPEEIVEVAEESEAPAAEEQSLEDATYEADAHVEQSGSYEESEAVETAMTEVVDSIIEEPAQTAVEEPAQTAVEEPAQTAVEEPAQAAVEEPKITQEVDPVTGQSKPSGGGSEESDTEEDLPLVVDEDQGELQAPAEAAIDETEDQPGGDTEADVASDAAEARREGEKYDDPTVTAVIGDEKPGTQTAVVEEPTGIVGDEGVDVDQIEKPQIERQLPVEEILAAGMSDQGLIIKGATQSQMPDKGKGTSGSGPPVTGKSGKSVDVMVPGNSKTGRYLDRESMKNGGGVVPSGDGKGFWEQQDNGDWYYVDYEVDDEDPPDAGTPPQPGGVYSLTPDGDTPMPYTGSTYGGEPTDLSHKPPAGPDECGFLRMLTGVERDANSYYGYGSSGSTTFSPGGGGDEDDSAHFHGGLSGGDRVSPSPDPDDWDYYTPNVLAEALEKLLKERDE